MLFRVRHDPAVVRPQNTEHLTTSSPMFVKMDAHRCFRTFFHVPLDVLSQIEPKRGRFLGGCIS